MRFFKTRFLEEILLRGNTFLFKFDRRDSHFCDTAEKLIENSIRRKQRLFGLDHMFTQCFVAALISDVSKVVLSSLDFSLLFNEKVNRQYQVPVSPFKK